MPPRVAFEIGDVRVAAGSRQTVELPVSVLSDHTPVTLSAHVIHGRRDGPVMFVSAAIHGDEIIGVPTRYALGLNGSYRNNAVLTKGELFDNGAIKTDEYSMQRLGHLEGFARFEKNMNGRSVRL